MSTDTEGKSNDLTEEESITDKDWLELSWNYFSLLSGQRMGMTDFFIVIEVALIGALFSMMGKDTRIMWVECTICIAITLISLAFFLLDYRTKTMIHCCEKIMSDMEEKYCTAQSDINLPFHHIEQTTESAWIRITYSSVFRILFFLIGAFGLVCFILLIRGVI